MWEIWVRSLGRKDPLEKEMAIHSSILAWKISWTGKPGRLHSMELQRVGHNWETSLLRYQGSLSNHSFDYMDLCQNLMSLLFNTLSRQCQKMLKLLHKVMLKILQARLQQDVNHELPDVQAGFKEGRGTRDQIVSFHGSSKKQVNSRKHLFLLCWLYQSLWMCGSQ